ncbi:hypothetical protein Tco_0474305 [Tanacetum coccineum]
MPIPRLVLQCLKGEATYHGQVDPDVIFNRKRKNRKFLNDSIDVGPYEFKMTQLDTNRDPRPEIEDNLTGDALKQYETDIEAMNLILISIPNDIYNSVDSFDRETSFNNKFDQFIAEPRETLLSVYNRFAQLINNLKRNKIDLPTVTINTKFLNCLQPEWLKNEEVVQADKANIQSKIVGNDGRIERRSYNVQEETTEGSNVQKETENNDEARFILSNEQNDFLLADAAQMEELEELSANICMMAEIQPESIESNEGPIYDTAFISEVQTSSTSYVNPLFTDSNHEQMYHEQPKLINSTIGDDQINRNIIFDDPNGEVNSGSVEHDKNVYDSYELEQLVRNAYKEVEKQQMITNNEILEDATKSQIKMQNKLKDPIAIEKKQNFLSIDYKKLNALYETFVLQVELSAEQKYFSSVSTTSETSSNAITLQTSPTKKKHVDTNTNVIASGMYKVNTTNKQETRSVRRPSSRGSSSKNSVLLNTKNHSEDVEVHVRTNKKTNVASKKNVVQNKKIVTNVDVKNALKAKDVLCISCDKNVLTPCHDKCLAKYKLNVHSKVRIALFSTPRTAKPKSLDTTPVVTKLGLL